MFSYMLQAAFKSFWKASDIYYLYSPTAWISFKYSEKFLTKSRKQWVRLSTTELANPGGPSEVAYREKGVH